MKKLKRIKLNRLQKIIRNMALIIVLLAMLPFLFDMHFGAGAAADKALKKAGISGAEYIADYEFKTRPSFADNRYTVSKRFYELDTGGSRYMITVPYSRYMGVLYKAKTPDIAETSDRVKITSVKKYEAGEAPDYISGRKNYMNIEAENLESLYGEFPKDWANYSIGIYSNLRNERVISFDVSFYSMGFYDDYKGRCSIVMNIDTQEILTLASEANSWNPVDLEDKNRQAGIKYKGKLTITENRARDICNTLYSKIEEYLITLQK